LSGDGPSAHEGPFFIPAAHIEPARRSSVSLIERALAVTVTMMVIAIGWSAYRTYTMRLEIAGSVRAVEFVQALVLRAFHDTGTPPATESDLGPVGPLTPPRSSISALYVHDGRIEIVFAPDVGEGIAGRSLYLTPFESVDHGITWQCGNRAAPIGLYPLGFADGTNRPEGRLTTVDERYLPEFCR
jgi:hypothetical protein